MSRLSELLRQARSLDSQLGVDLEAEFSALMKRRTFGLVFEPHEPEAVELPSRAVRRGDTVRILAARGETRSTDQRLWRVARVDRTDEGRLGHLLEIGVSDPDECTVSTTDLVVIAAFNERIYPGLVETGNVSRGNPSQPSHTVINAENFHALELLTYTHRHSIDAIYIDPPYNTGSKDWKYNNDYVERDDDYRHSKWLSFMERRLLAARELLNPDDSVIIVTIDEKEYLRLGLLLEQTFPEARIQMVTYVINPRAGVARPGAFTRTEEYAYFVFVGERSGVAHARMSGDELALGKPKQAPIWFSLMRTGSNSSRNDRPNLFYPIWVDVEGHVRAVGDSMPLSGDRRDVEPPEAGLKAVWPIRPNGDENTWQLGPSAVRRAFERGEARVNARDGKFTVNYLRTAEKKRIAAGEIEALGRDERGALVLRHREGVERLSAPRSVWRSPAHDAGLYGSSLLTNQVPGRKFPFPKSLYAVEDTLRFVMKDKPNATVLDFFSGSGTTANAVMRLNRQDGGQRLCISVTNNEVSADEQKTLLKKGLRPGDDEWEQWGICDHVTKPRITAAITGQTPNGEPIKGSYKFVDEFPMSEGFDESARFFTLTYEDPLTVRHDRAFSRIAPILWLRAGSRGRIIDDLGPSGWDVAESYGVVKNMDQMAEFAGHVGSTASVATVFVITDSDAAFQMTCKELPGHVTPVRLYESYLHNFAINRRS